MRSLHAAGLRQEIEKYERFREHPLSWGYEQLEATERALAHISGPVGEVLRISRFVPSAQDEDDLEMDERSTPCPMCTLGL
ncbi:MAG: hypothetical protein AzoDbin1_01841 [Azoarcus sp.]|nr:hypothetical protein [Azoarcus sp.]